MSRFEISTGCAHCHVNRRNFLATGCAACAGAAGLGTLALPSHGAETEAKVRVRIIYALHAPVQPGPDWPNIGFQFQPVMDQFVADLRARCPGVEFVTSMASHEEAAKKIVAEDKNASIDGYVVFQLNCWNRVVQTVAATGKPTLYVDFPYGGSGGYLVYTSEFLRNKTPNIGFISAAKIEDVAAVVPCFATAKKNNSAANFASMVADIRRGRTPAQSNMQCTADAVAALAPKDCLAKLREAKLLVVANDTNKPIGGGDLIQQQMGIEVVAVPFAELNEAWKVADKDQARAIADRWQKNARAIVDVSRDTLENSAAMYLGQKALLTKYGAKGITINCLGGFYGGHIHAYPCLGFHELNNEGLIGGCEADVPSAISMIAMNTLTQGRPGFISDPVIDTAARQIIYAHCVASNKPFGPQGPANAFEILTHSEDRKGAAVRSLFPVGYMTTTVLFSAPRKEILFHQGKGVANVTDDRACRTKLAAEPVGDIEKLFTQWSSWGWHRVTVFGDLKEPVFALADALGWKIVQEA